MPPNGDIRFLVSDGCRGWPHPTELGMWLELLLGKFGFSAGPPAPDFALSPCQKRAKKLNTWGARVAAWFKR